MLRKTRTCGILTLASALLLTVPLPCWPSAVQTLGMLSREQPQWQCLSKRYSSCSQWYFSCNGWRPDFSSSNREGKARLVASRWGALLALGLELPRFLFCLSLCIKASHWHSNWESGLLHLPLALDTEFSNLCAAESPWRLVKIQISGSYLQSFWFSRLGVGLGMCILTTSLELLVQGPALGCFFSHSCASLMIFFPLSPEEPGPRREALSNFNSNDAHNQAPLTDPLL